MTGVVMAFVLVGSAALQMRLPGWVILGQAKWPFLLASVLYYALKHHAGVALVAALIAGFLQDSLSAVPLGHSSACFAVIAAVASGFSRVVLADSLVTQVFFGGVASAAMTVASYALLAGAGQVASPMGWLLLKTLGAGLLGSMATPTVFSVAGRLDRLVGNVDAKETLNGYEQPT
jgi:rod shape-determining protein MreD